MTKIPVSPDDLGNISPQQAVFGMVGYSATKADEPAGQLIIGRYSTSPTALDSSRHPVSAFGKCEAELAAQLIVKFQQNTNPEEWKAFTKEEISDLIVSYGSQQRIWDIEDGFELLAWSGFIWQIGNGVYCVTDLFIARYLRGLMNH